MTLTACTVFFVLSLVRWKPQSVRQRQQCSVGPIDCRRASGALGCGLVQFPFGVAVSNVQGSKISVLTTTLKLVQLQQKSKIPYEDEEVMTQIYGKAQYQKGRKTMKDPYLHFQNQARPRTSRVPSPKRSDGEEIFINV